MTGVELFTLFSQAVTLGDVLTVGGGIMGAAGAAQQATAAARASEYNAATARMEAKAEEDRRRRESQRQMGALRAGLAKSGVTSEGTPLMVLAESAELAELDALSARWSGETSAKLSEQRARSARKSIPYTVGASLLSTAGKVGARRME